MNMTGLSLEERQAAFRRGERETISREQAERLKQTGMYWELEHLFVVEGKEV